MRSLDVTSIRSGRFPQASESENHQPSKFKALGFAVVIILGIGGLVIAGVGVGALQAGSMFNLGQVNLIIMIAISGGGSIPLLSIGIAGFVRTRSNHQTHANSVQANLQNKKKRLLKTRKAARPLAHKSQAEPSRVRPAPALTRITRAAVLAAPHDHQSSSTLVTFEPPILPTEPITQPEATAVTLASSAETPIQQHGERLGNFCVRLYRSKYAPHAYVSNADTLQALQSAAPQ